MKNNLLLIPLLLLLFTACRTSPPEIEENSDLGIETSGPKYSLAAFQYKTGTEPNPLIEQLFFELFPGTPNQIKPPEVRYYWDMTHDEILDLQVESYPFYLPDLYNLGDYWYLLLTQKDGVDTPLSRRVIPLGTNPGEESSRVHLEPLMEQVKKPLVIIDPGHGGRDPGAVGANGRYEKQYNQRVSRELKEELEDRGFAVLYTYDPNSDDGMSLNRRADFSNYYRQALFISIHHNSSYNPEDRGFSIFFSSYSENEDSEQAYIMVHGEEKPFLKQTMGQDLIHLYYEENNEVKRLDLPNKDPEADTFVRDRQSSQRARSSFELALALHQQMNELNWISPFYYNHRLIDERDYRVLSYNPNAAVIVECGFLSNLEEAELLRQHENVNELVQALADGVEAYSSSTGRLAALSLK